MRFGSFLTWDVLALAFTGTAIVALAAWVFILKPNDPRHRAFGLYLFLYGTADVGQAIPFVDARERQAMYMVTALTFLMAMWALAWFLLVYPRSRLTSRGQRHALLAIGIALAALAVAMLVAHDAGRRFGPDGQSELTPWALGWDILVSAGFAFAPLVFSRDLLHAHDEKERSALRLVTLACAAWPLYDLTTYGMYLSGILPATIGGAAWLVNSYRWLRFLVNILALVAAVNLMRSIRRHDQPMAPWPLALAIGPSIAVARVVLGFEGYAIGIVDLFLPTFVTIAILRGGLFGLDVKLRFAISKSTVAAVFIAVFFIASEGAQILFGRQNELVGLVAAGALVFAMTPLQRMADRLASKAIPGTVPTTATTREDAFRDAVRLALRGGITRKEEFALARLARELSVDAHRALELRDEIEGATTKEAR